MKMIIMVTPCLYQRTAHLAHLGVVEVDELDKGVPQKQTDQSDRSCLIVDCVPVRAPRSLADQLVFADRADIHVDAPHVRGMVESESTRHTDVPDAKFSVIDCLPLAFNLKYHGQHSGVGILGQMTSAGHAFDIAVHVVARFFRRLREHEVAKLIPC